MKSIDSLILSAKEYIWGRDGITDSALTLQKDGVIIIWDHIKRSQWLEFESALQNITKSLVVSQTDCHRNGLVIRNLRLCRHKTHLDQI